MAKQDEPVTLPDVAAEPHPTAHADSTPPGGVPDGGQGVLQEALPEITEAARKVGGFKKLAEIAGQLSEVDAGH
jgi:hypothetical protein